MFASFEASNSKLVTVSGILLVILIIVTIILRPYLDVLLLGRAQAINLGVSYENMTRMFLILVAFTRLYIYCINRSCNISWLINCQLSTRIYEDL